MKITKVAPINDSDAVNDNSDESQRDNNIKPTNDKKTAPSDTKPQNKTGDGGIINEAFVKDENKGVAYGSINSGQSPSAPKVLYKGEDHGLLSDNQQVKDAGDSREPSPQREPSPDRESDSQTPQVVFRRWFMLAIFCMYSFSSAFQWIHLNIIGNIITQYYNESLPHDSYEQFLAVDMLSMIYMIMYIPFIFPATWLLDKKGLRVTCLLGSLINAAGAWVKCGSVAGDRFAVLMFAQTICALAQNFVLGIPPRLAAVWFGPDEVSTATSIGVFGNQVGVAIGFLLPPMIVRNTDDTSQVTKELNIMLYSTAVFTTIVFFLILVFFRKAPSHPPSRAQQLIVEAAAHENYLQSLKALITNKGFFILTIAYGINTGSFYAISTLLNTVVLHYFEGHEEDAGRIGLTLVLMGVLGAILGGLWLDRTKTFKSTTIVIYILSVLGMIAFTFTLDVGHIWIVYVTAGSLGFFMTGYLPVGFEFAAEITYPSSEGTSSGILNCSAQIFGVIFTLSMRAMVESVSVISSNIILSAFLVLGCILTAVIRADYRRQAAGREALKVLVQEKDVTANSVENQTHRDTTSDFDSKHGHLVS